MFFVPSLCGEWLKEGREMTLKRRIREKKKLDINDYKNYGQTGRRSGRRSGRDKEERQRGVWVACEDRDRFKVQ